MFVPRQLFNFLCDKRKFLRELSSRAGHLDTSPAWSPARSLVSRAAKSVVPSIPRRPRIRCAYGHSWEDEYSWLERPSRGVDHVLQRERQYFDAWMHSRQAATHAPDATQEELLQTMLSLLPREQVTAPERVGPYWYYVAQRPNRPHPCYMRRAVEAGGGEGREEVVLDVNELAGVYGDGISVGQVKLSRCHQRVAFSVEEGDGSERQRGLTRNLRTGALRDHAPLESVVSLEWAADGRTILYTQPNQLGRPWRVLQFEVGEEGDGGGSRAGRPVFEEVDERFFVELTRTKDWAYLGVNCNSKTSSEVRLIPAGDPAAAPRLVCPRQEGLEYFVEHHSGRLLLLSNARGATDYALFSAPVPSPSSPPTLPEEWDLLVGPREGVAVEDMDVFDHGVVLYERHRGRQAVTVLPLAAGPSPAATGKSECSTGGGAAGGSEEGGAGCGGWGRCQHSLGVSAPAGEGVPKGRGDLLEGGGVAQGGSGGEGFPLLRPLQPLEVPLPPWALCVSPGANADFHSPSIRLTLSSPVHPDTGYDYHMHSHRLRMVQLAFPGTPLQAPPGVKGHDPQEYRFETLWATSADGAAVPLTVAHRTGVKPDGTNPCLVTVYGAYGHCLVPEFAAERVPLLQRGWVLAWAHVRGGGELGRSWHGGGRGRHKERSVDDLAACVDRLVQEGLTSSGRVAVEAASAGGLTAAAFMQRHPSALAAALLEAPFVDVLTAMCDPDLPLTMHEYGEWGDPSDPETFHQLRRLCPYQNMRPGRLPALLVTCSQSDFRVPYWAPLKFVARARAAQRGTAPVLLLPDAHQGHFAHEMERYQVKSLQYACLLKLMDCAE